MRGEKRQLLPFQSSILKAAYLVKRNETKEAEASVKGEKHTNPEITSTCFFEPLTTSRILEFISLLGASTH